MVGPVAFRVIQEQRAYVGPYVFARESVAGGPPVREAFFAALHAHADENAVARGGLARFSPKLANRDGSPAVRVILC